MRPWDFYFINAAKARRIRQDVWTALNPSAEGLYNGSEPQGVNHRHARLFAVATTADGDYIGALWANTRGVEREIAVVVHADWRRRGIATELIDAVGRDLAWDGCVLALDPCSESGAALTAYLWDHLWGTYDGGDTEVVVDSTWQISGLIDADPDAPDVPQLEATRQRVQRWRRRVYGAKAANIEKALGL
jgi:GNAT superfamily N-acetyltransferase